MRGVRWIRAAAAFAAAFACASRGTAEPPVAGAAGPFASIPVTLQLFPRHDAYVKRNVPTTNFGDDVALRVRSGLSNQACESFLKFFVKGPGAVTSATLRLRVEGSNINNTTLYRVNDISWEEGSVTWDSRPAMGAAIETKTNLVSEQWVAFDVSSYVTSWGYYSFGLATTQDAAYLDWHSKESVSSPVLEAMFDGNAIPPQDPNELEILAMSSRPQGAFFRSSESQAKTTPYAQWDASFPRLHGIIGKTLNEQGAGANPICEEFFTQYKINHAKKMALVHISGNARDKSLNWEMSDYFPGHWIHEEGKKVTQDVTPSTTTITVEDASYFATSDTVGIYVLSGGKIDWVQYEYVVVVAVDASSRSLTVARGQFGSAPRSFIANQAYAAAIATTTDNGTWRYNFALSCPVDAQGENCIDRLMENFKNWWAPGGHLDGMNGLEFDVDLFSAEEAYHKKRWRHMDVNGDMKPDAGFINGLNDYALGKIEFQQRLRALMGPNRILMGDIQGAGFQRATWLYNGGESEEFPTGGDRNEINQWSDGANRFRFWMTNAQTPRLCYARVSYDDYFVQPIREMRLQNAGLQMFDGFPGVHPLDSDNTVLDELVAGTAQQLNWLGVCQGNPVQLGFGTTDLLGGAGVSLSPSFVNAWSSEDASIDKAGNELKFQGLSDSDRSITATFKSVNLSTGSLLIAFDARADPQPDYPSQMPRIVWVHADDVNNLTVLPLKTAHFTFGMNGVPETAMGVQDLGHEPAEVVDMSMNTYAQVQWNESENAGVSHWGYYITLPSFSISDNPFVAWQKTVSLPAAPRQLTVNFCCDTNNWRTGLGGIIFQVTVNGQSVMSVNHASRNWNSRTIDLSAWAGQTVTLRFTTKPAANYNGTCAVWGPAWILPAGQAAYTRPATAADQLMTMANAAAFPASFGFRDLGPGAFNISLHIEGDEPVYLSNFRVYNSEDLWAREYRNGVILANPSTRAQVFDLSTLFPGRSFQRIQGTANQDPATNNGGAAGSTVTVPAMDGLLLLKQINPASSADKWKRYG